MPLVPPNTSRPCSVQITPATTSSTPMTMSVARFTSPPPSRRGGRRHLKHPPVGLHQTGVEAGRRTPQEQTEAPEERFTEVGDDVVALRVEPLRPTLAREVVVV